MGMQLGLGFGKGRRVIKTIYAGDRLQAALERQRQWFRDHAVEDAAPQKLPMAKAGLRPKHETPSPPALPPRAEHS